MKISSTPKNRIQAFQMLLHSLAICFCLVSSLSAQTIEEGLILQMGFSETLEEKAGNATVTEFGNISYNEDRNGGNRCALWLSGMFTDYLKVSATSENALTGDDPFSISVWFKTLSTNNNFQKIITKGPNVTGGFELGLFDGNTPLAGDRTSGYGLWDNEWNLDPNLGNDQNWHHLVLVRNAQNEIFLYRDGQLRNSDDTYDFQIGDDPNDYYIGRDFQGFIDDLRVYDRALNPNDVVALYNLEADCELIISPTCLDVQYDNSPFPFTAATYNPGSSIDPFMVLTDGIKLTLENWRDQNNADHFKNLILYGYLGIDNDLFVLDSIGMKVDLSGLNDPIGAVNFTLLPACCGQGLNLSINNGPTYYYPFINDVPNVLPDGTQVEMTIDSTFGLDWKYYLSLSGSVFESITIGGADGIAIKDFCFEEATTNLECFGFPDFPDGTFYGEANGQSPGFQMATGNSDLKVTLEEFDPGNGASPEFDRIENHNVGPYYGMLSVNLKVDFTNVAETVTEFSFITPNNGPDYNFAANGGAIVQVYDLNTLPISLPGGATLDKALIAGTTDLYYITISGPDLSSVMFGGLDMNFHQMCYTTITQNTCAFENLEVSYQCNDGALLVDFEHNNAPSEIFELYLDGDLFESYIFSDLPLEIPLSSEDYTTAKVCLKNHPNCCSEIVDILPMDCEDCFTFTDFPEGTFYGDGGGQSPGFQMGSSNPNVKITLEEFIPGAGASPVFGRIENPNNNPFFISNSINVKIDFTNLPDPVTSFSFVHAGGAGYNFAANGESILYINTIDILPTTLNGGAKVTKELIPGSTNLYRITISAANLTSVTFGGADMLFNEMCYSTALVSNCAIENLVVEHHCPDFYVMVDFEYDNPGSDFFDLYLDGTLFGTYLFTDLPLDINQLPTTNAFSTAKVCVKDDPSCCSELVDVQRFACSPFLGDPTVTQFCNNSVLQVNFPFNNPGNDSFELYLDGAPFGTYLFSSIPLSITLPVGSPIYQEAKVCTPSFCTEWVDVILEGCEPCDLNQIEVAYEVLDCNAAGEFSVQVTLLDITNNSDSFGIVGNGQHYGHFSFSDPLPEIGPFPGDGNTVYELGFYDLSNPDCKEFIEFGPINCQVVDCEINDLIVEFWDCDQDGNFLVDLNFNYNGVSDSFNIFGNGANYGTFAYTDLWLTIGPFPGDGVTEYEFIVVDQNDQECKAVFELGTISCAQECNIYEVIGEASDCDAAGNFTVDIDFEIQNPVSDAFMVVGNGVFYGTFDYSSLPITLGPFPGNSGNDLQFNIFDAADPFCIGFVNVEAVNCNSTCEIDNLIIEDLGCVNGVNKYKIDFDIFNPGNDGFVVNLLGENLGSFSYADLPVYVTYNATTNTSADLQICDQVHPNCCISEAVEIRDCSNDCPIINVEAEAVECINGEFYAYIEVESVPSNSTSYTIIINNTPYGPFTYTSVNQLIGPFPANTSGTLDIEVHDPVFDCSLFFKLDVPNCPTICSIEDLVATPLDCTGPNTISIQIDFAHQNTNSDLFLVYTSNNTLHGTYSLADLPLIITDFPDSDQNTDLISVCIKDNPNCCTETVFQALNCNNECDIFDLISTPTDCNADGQFFVNLDFSYENPSSNSFQVVGNGNNYGQFLYTDLPIQLGPFNGNGSTVLEFIVSDINNDLCIAESILDSPLCGQDCSITDLNANWEGCNLDGTSNLYLNFNYQNPNNDLFDVFFQGEYVGTYELDQLPITIHNFPNVNHNQGFDSVKVCINDNPDCCAEVAFDILNCPMDYTCIDFEELSPNMTFSGNEIIPGNFVFESAGIDVSFGDCYAVNSSSIFQIRDQYDNGSNCGSVTNSGQTLFLQNAGINLDFSTFNPIPSSVSFDFCNEGFLSIPGITDSIFFDANPFSITLATGHEITIEPYGPNSLAGTVTITGGIEGLTICGVESTFDNICINSNPPTPNNDCVAFEELEDGFSYNLINHDALLLESNGVEVNMLDGISYAQATSTPQWTMFNAASGLHIFLGGELEFDFKGIGDPVEFVSFDFSGGVDNELTVNGGNTFSFDFNTPDTVLFVAPGITMFFNRDATNTSEGNISLFGEVENMVIGGVELAIDNVCYYTSIQVAQVWPGDANSDNIANHCDLLNLGVAFGQQGFSRANANITWDGYDAEDWPNFFADGTTNFKHADCNGDGIINKEDLEVIDENYGFEHGPVEPIVSLPSTANDPPIYVDLESLGTLAPGQTVEAPLVLGSFDVPVEGIYGIAFTLEYDPTLILPSSIEFNLKESWLGTPDQDLLSIDRSDMADGRIEIAISRIDQINVGGYGDIGNFIGVIDDIVGKYAPTSVSITNIKAINAAEEALVLHAPDSPGLISTDLEDNRGKDGMLVFPVPTTDILNIHNYNPIDMRMITVYNVLGQKLHEERFPKQKTSVDVSTWPSGIYYIDIKLPDVVITRKFKVTRI